MSQVGAIVAFVCAITSAPSPAVECNEKDVFQCIVDRLWPLQPAVDIGTGYSTLIVLRRIPGQSVDAEAYAVLKVHSSGKVVAEYSRPIGASLFNQIRAAEASNVPIGDIEQHLKLDRTRIPASEQLRQIVREYQRTRTSIALPDGVYLDADRYDISTQTPMNHATIQIYDSADARNEPLLRWAKKTLRILETQARNHGH